MDLASASLENAEIKLKRQEETNTISWGYGETIIPAETQYRDVDQKLIVDRGWIWGLGGEIHPTVLQTGNTDILIPEGAFALE
jgi:hypothetical protein